MWSARWLWLCVGLAILFGVFFRVEHIERRSIWTDETWTALRLSGHSYADVRALFDDATHSDAQILNLQRVGPSSTLAETVSGLAAEEPQHPPLFYAIDRYWAALTGSGVADIRFPAMVFSVLAIAGVFWFCIELTGSGVAAAAAAALMAVSPFFVDYAGQAREYSLWTAMIAITSALLLRTARRPNLGGWLLYGLAMTIGLYSDLLMVLVLLGHAVYVGISYRRERKVLGAFAAAGAGSLVLFLPWLAICISEHQRMVSANAWILEPYPWRVILGKWIFNTGTVLFDAEYANMRLIPIAGVMLVLIAVTFLVFLWEDRTKARTMLLALAAAVALPQVAVDIATHGHESSIARYMTPLWLVLLVAVALFFARRMERGGGALHSGWFVAFCAVLAVSTISSAINSRAVGWWDNNDDYPWTRMAAAVNTVEDPFVLSEQHAAAVLVMSHYVKPATHFYLFRDVPPALPSAAAGGFLLAPSVRTVDEVAHLQYQMTPIAIQPYTQASAAVLKLHEAELAKASHPTRSIQQASFLWRLARPLAER